MARSDTNIIGGVRSETCQQTSLLALFRTRRIESSEAQVMFCVFESAYLHGRVISKRNPLFFFSSWNTDTTGKTSTKLPNEGCCVVLGILFFPFFFLSLARSLPLVCRSLDMRLNNVA